MSSTITADTFTTWLRGFVDALDGAPMTVKQVERVRTELSKVVAEPAAPQFIPYQTPFYPTQPVIPDPWSPLRPLYPGIGGPIWYAPQTTTSGRIGWSEGLLSGGKS